MSKKEDFLRVFPENLKKYENLKAIAESYAENFDLEVTSKIELLEIYLKMENQKDETLDKLAWQWDVDFYSSGLPKSQKIDLIKNSLYFNSTKGTRAVLQQALDIVSLGVEIKEWWEYPEEEKRTPFTFKLTIPNNYIVDEIINMTKIYKNARSTLEEIVKITDLPTNINIGGSLSNYTLLESKNDISEIRVQTGVSYYSKLKAEN